MTSPVPPPTCPAHTAAPFTDPHGHSAFPFAEATFLPGPDFAADPAALYERLRAEHGPVAPVVLHDGVPAWLVLGYNEVAAVLRDEARFSANSGNWRELAQGRVPATWPLLPVIMATPTPRSTDGAELAYLRGIISGSLAKLRPRQVRRHVEDTADQLIAAFSARGEADLMADFAKPLPGLVMARLLGVPEEQVHVLVDGVARMVDGGPDAPSAGQLVIEMLAEVTAAKATWPERDLISWMLAGPGRPAGRDINDPRWVETVAYQAWLVLCGGLEASQVWIANCALLVMTSALGGEMRGGRLTVADALSAALWQYAPVQNLFGRWALTDVPLGRVVIQRGDMVIVGLAAAGSDPAIEPGRAAASHSRSYPAFGVGPHTCPAADLGELITRIATEHLLQHVPGLPLAVPAEDLSWRPTLLMRGLASLPVAFEPFRLPTRAGLPR